MSALATLPPGPSQHPLLQLLRYSFWPLAYLEDCARSGETFTFRLAGFGTLVQLTRPEDIREVFRADSTVLHAGEGNAVLSSLVGDTSVLVLDEDPHARQRRILMPPLKGERMQHFFEAMQSEALGTCQAWAQSGEVRADEAMFSITLRVVLRAVLGVESGPDFDEFELSMKRLLETGRNPLVLMLFNVLPPHKWANSRWVPFYRLKRRFDARLYELIAARRAAPTAARTSCLLDDLIAMRDDDDQQMSDVEIRDAVVTILAAGNDTTALSLAWALEQIVPRDDVVAAIEAELSQVCGAQLPRAQHIAKLTYLDAVVRETLRVRNILPFVVRVVKREITIGDFTYPPGVVLCPSIHLLHRRPDLYPEPEQFRPQRYLERRFLPQEWNPFGGGNRACLGQAFALYEMKVVLATLFSELKMSRPVGAHSKPVRRGIAVGPHDGVRLTAVART
ncbi:MAG: cytochrome P450 [Gammaproteobacteria bacterium]|jgi:cytochrome P450